MWGQFSWVVLGILDLFTGLAERLHDMTAGFSQSKKPKREKGKMECLL